ncbi:MAG TPA: hypothetical protein VHE13_18360 [Opitutus sp.]|nr:hypothetical protein [Opitutus sp.]
MNTPEQSSHWKRSLPALALIFAAPMITEVLPGATRFSSIFVLPIEMCVWGGGALMIREVVRRRRLGWRSLLFLGLALAIAEECLIQQTSLAPLVIQLKGQVYARAFGVNYVYLLWALVYEAVFVVFVPVKLVELMFPARRDEGWLNRGGLIAVAALFVLGAFLAWFSWTQIARTKVFHLPDYTPPLAAVVIAVAAIVALVFLALPAPAPGTGRARAPAAWIIGVGGAVWAVLWYGLVLLGFGIAPAFPPLAATGLGLMLVVVILWLLPKWSQGGTWDRRRDFAVVAGTMIGAMVVSFVGFIGSAPRDLYFKIIVDVLALIILVRLGRRVGSSSATNPG